MKILASNQCVEGGIPELQTMIANFRNSPCAFFTHQYRVGNPDAPMYIDFPKERILDTLNQLNCDGLRVYFAAQGGELTNGGTLTLVMVGFKSVLVENQIPEIHFFHDLINRDTINLNEVICCGHNPPPPNNIDGITPFVNFM